MNWLVATSRSAGLAVLAMAVALSATGVRAQPVAEAQPAADAQPATDQPSAESLSPLVAPSPPNVQALADQIDALLAASERLPTAAPADDAEFLRRVTLDLTGTIPTADVARAFLDDRSADKRAALIDRLLASPEYARHMQYVFDVMLMERRGDTHVSTAEWSEYLRRSFAEGKPLDQLCREILLADGTPGDSRPAARFYLERLAEPNAVTRDVARLMLGVDLGCAQCHDHPLVMDYLQEDYYGLYAFLNRSYLFEDKQRGVSLLAEKADGEATFKSVFTSDPEQQTGPHLPGRPPLDEPRLEGEAAWLIAPADGVRPVPRISRRVELAERLTDPQQSLFARNMANRLWAVVFGRGLVEPLDEHHNDNPPSHPEVLDAITMALVDSGFDVRALLGALARSNSYQRSSRLPEGVAPEEISGDSYSCAPLKPLSPEQLCWSLLEATGTVHNQRLAAAAALEADPLLADLLAIDPERQRLATQRIERAVYEKFAGQTRAFASLFGALPGSKPGEFEATVHQALFLSNGGPVQGWLGPAGTNLTARLAALSESAAVAEELYLSVLSRRPESDEAAEVHTYLDARGADERGEALRELAWALLASTEFRFNH